jgi:basic amino acid/polyamine antiporter, APA family
VSEAEARALEAPGESGERGPGLVRSLTLAHAVLYGLGVTIGAGIYVLIGLAAGRAGMHAPLAFLAAAIVMGFSAATFAELATRMPVSASEAAYVKAAFGKEWLSLGIGLLVVGTAMVSGAAISVGSAGYISIFIPLPAPVIVTSVVILMGLVACLATAQSIAFAGLMTLIEVGGLVVIIAAGTFNGGEVTARFSEIWPGTNIPAWNGVASTTLLAVFAFIGFEHLVNVAEEVKRPSYTLPRALFLTLGLTALLYGFVAWIAVATIPAVELASSPAPLALVFERLTGMPLAIMSGIAIVATLNGVIVHMIMIGRVLYGLARQSSLPKALAHVNASTRAPIRATLVGVLVILGLALGAPLSSLAEMTSRLTLLIFAAVNLALIAIRNKEASPPTDAYVCARWVPVAGLGSSLLLLFVELLM